MTGPTKLRVLLLGGTTEAAALAREIAGDDRMAGILALAGRTESPRESALPTRVGGFGGVEGLVDYVTEKRFDVVVDATHPFAARMSRSAVAACALTRTPLLAIERPPWDAIPGDHWQEYESVEALVAALPREPTTIFSGLGRQSIAALAAAPQHTYIIRVVDNIQSPAPLQAVVVSSRGPFNTEDDIALFRKHGVTRVLAKNSGGDATYSKIAAARHLGLPVHMVRRPPGLARETVETAEAAMAWLTAHSDSRSKRGV
jgi:precorrin-6A/cobalt-precorrin-6A reductase